MEAPMLPGDPNAQLSEEELQAKIEETEGDELDDIESGSSGTEDITGDSEDSEENKQDESGHKDDDEVDSDNAEEEQEGHEEDERTLEEKIEAFRNKYNDDPEKLSQAAVYLRQMQTQQGLELGEKRQENEALREELSRLREAIQGQGLGQKEEEQGLQKSSDVKLTDQELDDLAFTDPARYRAEITNRIKDEIKQETKKYQIEQAYEEGQKFNNSLIDNRARELLLELATDIGDKSAVIKFANENYVPSQEEQAAVIGRLNNEIEWVNNNLKFDNNTFRFSPDAFQIAQLKLYGHEMLKQSEKNGKKEILEKLNNPEKGPTMLSPRGGSKTDKKIDLSKVTTKQQAEKAAETMNMEELKRAMIESEPL